MSDISWASPRGIYAKRPSSGTVGRNIAPRNWEIVFPRTTNVTPQGNVSGAHSTAQLRYSSIVYARFYAAATLLLLGFALAVFGIISETRIIGIVAGFLIFFSGVFALSWLERASLERHNN